ncbi:Peptidase family S41 [Dyadobacter soli]|uniref:Peptidase family S41 n=1 Tax=Dyadobacter soli TaxID=659014 RepID=A0A1G7Y1T4_9BACT|nr:S41 family peptidase [Dyadobacter soli]SDG90452.1 Peptidase family S41 [Dyadobacter soli]
MKHSLIVAALLQLTLHLSTGAQSLPEKKLASVALVSDLDMIRTSVVTLHPGLGRFEPREHFLHSLDSIRSVVAGRDSTTLMSFFRMVNPVLTKLRCGHTKFFSPMKGFPFYFYTNSLMPVIVRFDDSGGLLVTKSEYPQAVGKYITQVNGQPIDAILRALRAQMFVDGFVRSSADAQIQQYFSAWYADFIQQNEGPFTVALADESNNRTSIDMKGIGTEAWQTLNRGSSSLSTHNHLSFPSDSVARLRIATFYSTQGDKHFKRFLDSAFTAIDQRRVRRLIIDVRGNEGGNDALGKELYAHIALRDFRYYDHVEVKVRRKKDVPHRDNAYLPRFIGLARLFIRKDASGRLQFRKHQNLGIHHPRRKAYTGEVVFLMDGLSYSVTAEFLAVARHQNRGLFVGEESGGAYQGNSSGTFAIYKLPATGLDLGIPLAGYYPAIGTEPEKGRGVLPDVATRPSRQDLLSNQDPDTVASNPGN